MDNQIRIETNKALLTISHNEEDAQAALTIRISGSVIVLDAGQALTLADFLYQRASTFYRQSHDVAEQE